MNTRPRYPLSCWKAERLSFMISSYEDSPESRELLPGLRPGNTNDVNNDRSSPIITSASDDSPLGAVQDCQTTKDK